MNEIELAKKVEQLVARAACALNSDDAVKYSQAACNVADAIATLSNVNILESLRKLNNEQF